MYKNQAKVIPYKDSLFKNELRQDIYGYYYMDLGNINVDYSDNIYCYVYFINRGDHIAYNFTVNDMVVSKELYPGEVKPVKVKFDVGGEGVNEKVLLKFEYDNL